VRLRQRDLKTYTVKPRVPVKENDGTTSTGWGESRTIKANVQPAGGKMMSEIYGERLAYMATAYTETTSEIHESDGLCIFVTSEMDPDYIVVAIRRWNTHTVFDLEKVKS